MLRRDLCVAAFDCNGMPCYSPLDAYRSRYVNKSGKRGIVFKKSESNGIEIQVPCGKCIGCRLEYSRQWAMRAIHEAQLHDENCVVMLSYDQMPWHGSLNKRDFTLFMKRLRKEFPNQRIRYLQCGEYGEELGRPHHHAAFFGIDFPDKKFFKQKGETILYTSEILSKAWGHGHCSVGELNFESAAYIARYVCKKVYGDQKQEHYTRVDPDSGEVVFIEPEYITMSRGGRGKNNLGGIGSQYFKRYSKELFPADNVALRGKLVKPPKYYLNQLEKNNSVVYSQVKKERKKQALKNKADNTYDRLEVKKVVKNAQIKSLTRDIDKELKHENLRILDIR